MSATNNRPSPVKPPVTATVPPTPPTTQPASPPVALIEKREEEVGAMELTLADIHTLSTLLSYNIQSPADLIARVRRLSTMSVDGVEIRLEDGLITRLKSRALSQWGPEWLRKQVTDMLHGYCGW